MKKAMLALVVGSITLITAFSAQADTLQKQRCTYQTQLVQSVVDWRVAGQSKEGYKEVLRTPRYATIQAEGMVFLDYVYARKTSELPLASGVYFAVCMSHTSK